MIKTIRLIPPLYFFAVLLCLTGCVVQPTAAPQPEKVPSYRSDLADPAAKALFAYAEFRLLAGQNRWDEAIEALRRAVYFDAETEYLRMNLAKALLHKDQSGESISLLGKILQQAPDNIEAHELLGDLLDYQGDKEQAVEHYRLALELDPDDEMLQLRLAMGLEQLGQSEEAIDLLRSIVARNPEARLAHLSLARFYQRDGQPEKSMRAYQSLLKRHPGQQQALQEYGQLLVEQGLVAEALSLYRQEISNNPRAIGARQQLALLYLRQKRYAEALEQLLRVHQQVPGNQQLLGRIGLLHLEMENWQESEAVFRQLLSLGENAGRNRYYLGLSLLNQEKYQQAIEVMAPIEQNSPVFSDAVLQLAFLYRQAEQFEPAIEALNKVLDSGDSKPEIYYYLAAFHGDSGDLETAGEVVQAGLKEFPDNVELLYQAAVLYEKQGDRSKAIELMERILTIDADYAEALNFIAYHHAEAGTELELALSRAQRALESKRSGYIIDTLGWIYFKMGRYAESREQLEEASDLLPEDPVILEHLGDLYRALSLWDKAAAAYRRALELDPMAAGVEEKLNNLPTGSPQ